MRPFRELCRAKWPPDSNGLRNPAFIRLW
jgi:hypothetical protein